MIFISYSAKDKLFALELHAWLLKKGYDPAQIFLDSDAESGIHAGADWKQSLRDGLKQCSTLIVLYSNHWRGSDWCTYELGHASALGKPIFPVLVENIPLGGMAAEYQGVRLFENREEALDRLWKSLEDQHLGPHDSFPWPHPALKGDRCPFPGLPAFDERYAAVFSGRETETRELLELLRRMRSEGEPSLLMIVGSSGSGKSSLLKAGVLPRLTHTADWVVLPTLRYGATTEDFTLFDQLARDVAAAFPAQAPGKPDWKVLRDNLKGADSTAGAKAVLEATQDLTMAIGKKDATVLIGIDQFEEFLSPAAGQSAGAFLRFLKAVFARKNGRLLAVGAMRSDYLDVYEKHPDALESPFFYPWRLGPFPRERISEVISRPAERAGIRVEPELLAELVKDTPTTEALPLLAFTLERLYRRSASDGLLELTEYKSLGGMEGAIQKSVERIVPENTPQPVLDALRLDFVKHLAQVNDKDEVVRLTAKWSTLRVAANPILEELVRERLLVKSENDRVEVAHEAIFRCWSMLRKWLRGSGEVMRWRRDVRREREADKERWHGLRGVQLELARKWPTTRREELGEEEVGWIKRGIRRQRIVRGLVIGAVLAILILAGVSWWQTEEANIQASNFKQASERAAHNLAINYIDAAFVDFGRKNMALGMLRLWQAYDAAPPAVPIRESALRLLGGNVLGIPLRHGDAIRCLTFSPDGRIILTGSFDKTARLWDARTGRPLHQPLQHQDGVVAVSFRPDGQTVVTGSWDGTARLWDARTGMPFHEVFQHGDHVNAVAFSPDGQSVLTGGSDGTARLWDAKTGTLLHQPLQHEGGVSAVAFSPDGQTILTGSWDNSARLWDARTGKPLHGQLQHVDVVAFSPDGQTVLTGGGLDKTAKLWDARTGMLLRQPLQHEDSVCAVAFSPDGQTILTGSWDNSARVWDTKTGTLLHGSLQHEGAVAAVAFSPDGQTILTGSRDRTARLWDARTGMLLQDPLQHEHIVTDVAFSPDGNTVLTGSADTARLWNVRAGKALHESLEDEDNFAAVALSPNGQTVLTGSWRNTANLWDANTGKPLHQPLQHGASVTKVAFSPDGRTVLTGGYDKTARLWDTRTGRPLHQPLQHEGIVTAVAYRPDGQTLLTGTVNGTARLWDARTGKLLHEPLHLGDAAVAFSPDGQTVLTESQDGTARLWDARTGKLLHDPLHHGDAAVASSPDGQTVLTGSQDGTARLWDARTGKLLREPLHHEDYIKSVAFSPDGKTLLTGSRDKTARLWDARTGKLLHEPLQHEDVVSAVAFGLDGQTILTVSGEKSVRLWTVPPPAGDQPERLRLSVEVRCGYFLDSNGIHRELTQAQWLERRARLDALGGFCDIRSWDQVSDPEKKALRTHPVRK